MIRVAAISAELPTAPSFRVRIDQPTAELERHGIRVSALPLFPVAEEPRFTSASLAGKTALALAARRRLRARIQTAEPEFDVALVHRRADLLPSLGIERCAGRGRRLIYDVDDAIWLDVRPDTRAHPLAFVKGSGRKVRWLAAHADRVIAGNEILAEHLTQFSSAVTVVPSVVDTTRIAVRNHAGGPELVLGWIGSHSTAPFVANIRPQLAGLAAALPDLSVRLLMVGGTVDPVRGVTHEVRPWSAEAQADALRRIDIGLMPLPDTPWNRGKCSYKALQYMAAGVPAVADDVGLVADVIAGGGYVVGSSGQWVDALIALAADPGLRERLGRAGRRRVEREFSLEAWAPVLAGLLRGEDPTTPAAPSITNPPGAETPRA